MNITPEGLPVTSLITTIKDAITQAGLAGSAGSQRLRVTSVQVTLQTVATMSGGGSIRFCVPFLGMRIGGGAKVSKENTHTVSMTLVPREEAVPAARAASADQVRDVLVEAITTIREAMASAKTGSDPWALSNAVVDISFALTEQGGISLGIDGGLDSQVANTLRLTLDSGPPA